ncbi:MAG TPA: pyridoxal-phosphate dependent enzyme, partial [Myxococcota bacterium]|nr:pyridoxal-phosphate dependent enzyme [Myxococcota bacterium]
MGEIALADVRAAAAELQGATVRTPCLHSRTLSELAGCTVFLKFENLQFTASFKERGALNKLRSLAPAERAAGVIAMSAGNHAQGVAYHARRLGIQAVVVMPRLTPTVKVEHTRALGAEVVLEGESFEDASARADEIRRARGLALVHPFDDPRVIAGQGTVALEMLEQVPELEALVVPVGGGGLISGCAVAARALRPGLELVGVECARFPSMKQALAGAPIRCGNATIANGIAVKAPGALTLPIVRRLVSEIVLVDEDPIEAAILLLLEVEKTVVEGAGA